MGRVLRYRPLRQRRAENALCVDDFGGSAEAVLPAGRAVEAVLEEGGAAAGPVTMLDAQVLMVANAYDFHPPVRAACSGGNAELASPGPDKAREAVLELQARRCQFGQCSLQCPWGLSAAGGQKVQLVQRGFRSVEAAKDVPAGSKCVSHLVEQGETGCVGPHGLVREGRRREWKPSRLPEKVCGGGHADFR